jgi:RNA polymerase sigma-70 factor (ECF subfamily)
MTKPPSDAGVEEARGIGTVDDLSLVVRAQEGDTRAFEVLIRRHEAAMYRLALSLLGESHAAADAVQNAFLAAWRRLGSLRADGAFTSWMYRIVTNQCLSLLRARGRAGIVVELESEIPSSDSGPETAAVTELALDAFAAAIAALPENLRVCWVLREAEQLG